MSRLPILHFRSYGPLLAMAALLLASVTASAHTSPSLTVEAKFRDDGSYTLQVNIDPRLLLSKQPATIPPVEAQWYRDLTIEERSKLESDADEYLSHNLEPRFDGQAVALSKWKYFPIDGGTSIPLGPETKEVHLLAELDAHIPAGAGQFQIALGTEANASMILLNSLAGKASRRPSVVFPGETSRTFSLHQSGSVDATTGSTAGAKTSSLSIPFLAGMRSFLERLPLAHLMLCVGLTLVSRRFWVSIGLLLLYHLLHLTTSPLSEGVGAMAMRSGSWNTDATLVLASIALIGISQGGKSRYAGWIVSPMALWQGFYFMAPNEHTVPWVLMKNAGLTTTHLALVLLFWALRGLWRGAIKSARAS